MKGLVIADLHLKDGPWMQDRLRVLDWLAEYAESHRVDWLAILGDLYGKTVPYRPTPTERGALEPFIARLLDLCPVFIVPGNHDDRETLKRLTLLSGLYQCNVLQPGPDTWVTPSGKLSLFAVPYYAVDWLSECIRQHSWEWVRADRRPGTILLGHCDIQGSVWSGAERMKQREAAIPSVIMRQHPFAAALLGHVHVSQTLFPAESPAHFLGPPWPTSFSERQQGYFWTVDSDDTGQAQCLRHETPARRALTLEYRWEVLSETRGTVDWSISPAEAERVSVGGRFVKARVLYPADLADTVPLSQVRKLLDSAHYLLLEPVPEPVHRVRSAALREATTDADRLRAWMDTLGTPPGPDAAEAGFGALERLQSDQGQGDIDQTIAKQLPADLADRYQEG